MRRVQTLRLVEPADLPFLACLRSPSSGLDQWDHACDASPRLCRRRSLEYLARPNVYPGTSNRTHMKIDHG